MIYLLEQIDSRYDYIFDVLEHDIGSGDISDIQPANSKNREVSILLVDTYLIEKWRV